MAMEQKWSLRIDIDFHRFQNTDMATVQFPTLLCSHVAGYQSLIFPSQSLWTTVMVCLCGVFILFPACLPGLCNRLQREAASLHKLIQHPTLPLCWTSNDQPTPWRALKFLHFSSRSALLLVSPSVSSPSTRVGDICLSEDKGQTSPLSVCHRIRLGPHVISPTSYYSL